MHRDKNKKGKSRILIKKPKNSSLMQILSKLALTKSSQTETERPLKLPPNKKPLLRKKPIMRQPPS